MACAACGTRGLSGLGAASVYFGMGCNANAEPAADELAIIEQIVAKQSEKQSMLTSCQEQGGPGMSACLNSVSAGYDREIALLSDQLTALCQAKLVNPGGGEQKASATGGYGIYIVGGLALVAVVGAAFYLGKKPMRANRRRRRSRRRR